MLEDPTFWALIGLVLFLGLLVYMKVPGAITGALDKRAVSISEELDQARKLREEAQSLLADYQRKAREAESEAEEIIDQAKREAEALGVEARQRMEDYVTSRTRMAEEKITQAEVQALQEVKALSADVAIAAAARLLAAKAKGEVAESLVASAIDDVKSKLH
ncbi:MAG: F0F1 ATP synthase subunit B [Hyphomicrobiales bacterium]|nr:F0F1 ATP synthase subunit B [Hyphomicrobiales bacterium]